MEITKEHKCYNRVQGCLYAADKDWCDFVVWTLRDMHSCKIPTDAAWWPTIDVLHNLYSEHLLPNWYKCLITWEFSTPGLNVNPSDRGETPSHLATQLSVDFNVQLYGQISTPGMK